MRDEFDAQLERERRNFHRFLVGVLIFLVLAAIIVVVVSIPNDSWLLEWLGHTVREET